VKIHLLGAEYDSEGNARHRGLHPSVESDIEWLTLWTFDGAPKLEEWAAAPRYVEVLDSNRPSADLLQLTGAGAFALTLGAAASLSRALDDVGELLPVSTRDGAKFVFLNVVPRVDCLDEVRTVGSRDDEGHFEFIERYAFDPSRLPQRSLFKIKQDPFRIFAIQRAAAAADDFKAQVERLGFRGRTFREVWNDDGDIIEDCQEFEKVELSEQ
jgi:hypothetical protein